MIFAAAGLGQLGHHVDLAGFGDRGDLVGHLGAQFLDHVRGAAVGAVLGDDERADRLAPKTAFAPTNSDSPKSF